MILRRLIRQCPRIVPLSSIQNTKFTEMPRSDRPKNTHHNAKNNNSRNQTQPIKQQQDTNIDVSGCIEIDGSILEGGGQILRNSVSLSALLKKPVHIHHIRANRDKPGLRPQHLLGIDFVGELFNARLSGNQIGSDEIVFSANEFNTSARNVVDTKTAGSIGLLIQISLPCLAFAPQPTEFTFKGGTNAEFAPSVDFLQTVLKPNLERFGLHFDLEYKRRGFYPRGGGEVNMTVKPVEYLTPVDLRDSGPVVSIHSFAFVSGNIPQRVPQIMIQEAEKLLRNNFDQSVRFTNQIETGKGVGEGCGILIFARTTNNYILSGDCLGKRGLQSEKVAQIAVENLLKGVSDGSCVDEYLQDQLIIYMALAKGTSHVKTNQLSMHTRTAIQFCELITGVKFQIQEDGKSIILSCDGIGYQNPHLQSQS
eukprot:TRINITY_DN5874_c0_g1_i1.p1 TRINITY_DN5874_c0_g1~~TRINITY_DN5874_c0_g1_i1.p1  ORF type:complete len:423 (-),score=50.28 TRINITY_DN5874_c0_g1_i1:43-1311(-)